MNRPVVVPGSPPQLKYGSSSGTRVVFKGVSMYGVPDFSNATMQSNYNNRSTTVAALSTWGGNIVRMRVHGNYYAGATTAQKTTYIQQIKDWRDLCATYNIYLMICAFDLTSPSNVAWSSNANVKTMYTDIWAALGDDPGVIYEPYNEPNQDTWATWQTYMNDLQSFFRTTLGYTGVLVIDPIDWANSSSTGAGFSDVDYTAIETYDAALAGMGGQHQIVFAKHDYASNWPSPARIFNGATWQNIAVGNTQTHLMFETEFGDNNASVQLDSWTQDACVFFGQHADTTLNFVGATAFQWNWIDNSITSGDYVTPTTYGGHVRDLFLKYDPSGMPPPAAWFKADTITGLVDQAKISTWTDSSGNGNDATQPTSANQSVYRANLINGLPAVQFTSTSSQYMTSTADDSFTTAGVTAFAVVALGSAGSNPPVIGAGGLGGFNFRFNSNTRRPEVTAQGAAAIGAATTALPLFTFGIISFDYTNNGASSTWRHFLNGAANGSGTAGTNFTAGLSLWLGGYYALNSFLNGWIAEAITYERVLSANERALVHSYLQDKYAIAVSDKIVSAGDFFGVQVGGAWKRTSSTRQILVNGTWQTKPSRKYGSGAWA